jgi:hypothetical protein
VVKSLNALPVDIWGNEYYDIIHREFPDVLCMDRGGKFGRIKMKESSVPLYWSCGPEGVRQDYVPASYAEAEYIINFANLKAHTGSGVTLRRNSPPLFQDEVSGVVFEPENESA